VQLPVSLTPLLRPASYAAIIFSHYSDSHIVDHRQPGQVYMYVHTCHARPCHPPRSVTQRKGRPAINERQGEPGLFITRPVRTPQTPPTRSIDDNMAKQQEQHGISCMCLSRLSLSIYSCPCVVYYVRGCCQHRSLELRIYEE
jgi:hypothetical protein